MQAVEATVSRAIPVQTKLETCDNSGAKMLKIFSIKGHSTVKGQVPAGGVGDFVMAVIVRQKKEYRRPDGTRIKFEDNAAVVVKDDKGNPKGTLFKGPIAKEAVDRWPGIAKLAKIIV